MSKRLIPRVLIVFSMVLDSNLFLNIVYLSKDQRYGRACLCFGLLIYSFSCFLSNSARPSQYHLAFHVYPLLPVQKKFLIEVI